MSTRIVLWTCFIMSCTQPKGQDSTLPPLDEAAASDSAEGSDAGAANDGGAEGTGTGDGDGGGGTDGRDSGAVDTGPAGSDGGEPPTGACSNPTDLSVHADEHLDIDAKMLACAVDSLGTVASGGLDALSRAVQDCMQNATFLDDPRFAFTLSEDCAGCYGENISCAQGSCALECIAGYDATACVSCRAEAGCDDRFAACTGL